MDISTQLRSLAWPESFIVHYSDESSERLLRNDGIHITLPGDDPDGHGGICADIPRKHPRNQKRCRRYISFSELAAISDEDGNELWRK